jgi:hypothetical protein
MAEIFEDKEYGQSIKEAVIPTEVLPIGLSK